MWSSEKEFFGTEWTVHHCAPQCFTLGSYDILIGVEWLEKHRAKVYFFYKVIECVDGKGLLAKVRGILHTISV